MQEFLKFFGHGFCHQIPARTFEAGGYLFSACARDTGIYLGFFFSIIAAFIVYLSAKKKPGELPPLRYLLFLILLVLPFAADGVTSYLSLRATTNTIRYITGYLAGIAMGSLIVPLLFAIRKDSDTGQRVFAQKKTVVIHLSLCFVAGLAFLFFYPMLGLASPLFAVLAFLSIPFSINLILLTLSRRFFPLHTVSHWMILTVICLGLTIFEVSVLGLLRDWVVQTLLNGSDLPGILS